MTAADPSGEVQRNLASVAAAIEAGDLDRASALARDAFARGIVHPILFNARALHLDAQGRTAEALEGFRLALDMRPGDTGILNAIAVCHARLGQYAPAIAAADKAVALDPGSAFMHYNRGWVLEASGEAQAARHAYERALALDPRCAAALAGLASLAARREDWNAVADLVGRALAIEPSQPTAVIASATADLAQGHPAGARDKMQALLAQPQQHPAHLRAVAYGLLADALHAERQPDAAFDAYTMENALLRQLHGRRFGAGSDRLIAAQENHFASRPPWPDAAGSYRGEARTHVFLVGFPRSGTTLLEQVLASHGDVVTLEERDMLAEAAVAYLSDDAGMDRLANLSGQALTGERARYWRRVRDHGVAVAGKVFVDKFPLNTLKLPVIAKLFPDAKVLFALRDPRDVVLSCFRRHFEINAAMYEFLTLEGAARLYDAVMRAGEVFRQRLPLPQLLHRYEDMIADFDASTRSVCAFVGIDWSPAMRDFAATARSSPIRSPSAPQVRSGLYEGGIGQWRLYERHLQPVMPILDVWAQRFGYA